MNYKNYHYICLTLNNKEMANYNNIGTKSFASNKVIAICTAVLVLIVLAMLIGGLR